MGRFCVLVSTSVYGAPPAQQPHWLFGAEAEINM